MPTLVQRAYMRGLDKILVFERRHTSLSSLPVHVLQLRSRVFLYFVLNSLDDFFVIRQVRTVTVQSKHVQRCGSFQGAVDVKEFARVLGSIKVGRHTAVSIRLCSQKIRIYSSQQQSPVYSSIVITYLST